MVVPEEAQRFFGLLETRDLQCAGYGERGFLFFIQPTIPLDPSRTQEQDVAGLKAQALPTGGCLELLGRNSIPLARREANPVCGGEALEVDQDAPSGDTAPRPMFDAIRPARDPVNLFFGDAVVKPVKPMAEMPQAVTLRGRLRVEIIVQIIEDIFASPMNRVAQGRSIKQGWMGLLQFPIHRKNLALFDQPCGSGHPFRSQQIQSPDLIVIAEYAPRGMGRIIRFDG